MLFNVFVDIGIEEEKILAINYTIEADSPEEAMNKAYDRAYEEYPGEDVYVWEVTWDDVLEGED